MFSILFRFSSEMNISVMTVVRASGLLCPDLSDPVCDLADLSSDDTAMLSAEVEAIL